MKSILYISHVSWGWIKQRPQFIAEELSRFFKVDVWYTKSNRSRKANQTQDGEKLRVRGFRFMPFERISFIPIRWSDFLNKILFYTRRIGVQKYDFVWITDPRQYCLIKGRIQSNQKLVYDCMDDMLEFPYIKKYPRLEEYMIKAERQLLEDADYVFCSAKTLQEKLETRYNCQRKMIIVNNGITDDIMTYNKEGDSLPQNSLVYIGTISEWFDFKSVISALDRFPELNVLLYGPIRMDNPPQHDRLSYMGMVNHKDILGIMNSATGLMMPFVLNALIESVNPVKLYEYIYSGKPICASRYRETEKFSDYVTLYQGEEEFNRFVGNLLKGEVVTEPLIMREFAAQNTWRNRAEQIEKELS